MVTKRELNQLLEEAGGNLTLAGRLYLERHRERRRGRGRPRRGAWKSWAVERARQRVRALTRRFRSGGRQDPQGDAVRRARRWLRDELGLERSGRTVARWAKEASTHDPVWRTPGPLHIPSAGDQPVSPPDPARSPTLAEEREASRRRGERRGER